MEEWLDRGSEVAALLDGEADPECLSDQEVAETTTHKYSYYRHDLAVIDWDAALVVDTPDGCQDVLYVSGGGQSAIGGTEVYDAKLYVVHKASDDVELATRPTALSERVGGCGRAPRDPHGPDEGRRRVCRTSPSSSAIGTWRGSTWAATPVSI